MSESQVTSESEELDIEQNCGFCTTQASTEIPLQTSTVESNI